MFRISVNTAAHAMLQRVTLSNIRSVQLASKDSIAVSIARDKIGRADIIKNARSCKRR